MHSEFFGTYGIDLSGETACLYACDYSSHQGGFISAGEVLNLGQRLDLNSPYSVTGKVDANVASIVALNQQVTGNIDSQPSPLGRLTLNYSVPGETADLPGNFVVYLVNANEVLYAFLRPAHDLGTVQRHRESSAFILGLTTFTIVPGNLL